MKVIKTEYKLLPKQGEFLFGFDPDLLNKEKVYNDIAAYIGGMGSGKTYCGSLRGLLFAFTWAGCRGLVGAKSQDLLDNTTKRKYEEHLSNMGMTEGLDWWYTDRKTQLNLRNGSIIRFKTLSDWEQFMSEEFTWIEFEEASFLDEITFIKLITRLREGRRSNWKNYYRSLYMHTNPQGRRGWINKHFINPKTRKKSYRYINASTRENHHLGDEYVEMLEELYSAEQILEMVEGLDTDTDNTVAFPNFTEDNIKDNIEVNPNEKLVLSCDFNYNPMCWYLMQEVDGVWHILREFIYQNVTTKEMCKLVQPEIDELIPNRGNKQLTIMGDAHGRDRKTNGSDYSVMINHFQDAGYDVTLLVQKANPFIKDRLAVLRGLIRNAKGKIKLHVHSSCKWLIYNFNENKNNLGNGGIKIPTDADIQKDPDKLFLVHPIDAISYPMHYLQSLRAIAGDKANL